MTNDKTMSRCSRANYALSKRGLQPLLHVLWVLLLIAGLMAEAQARPLIQLPRTGLEPRELAVIYIDGDTESEQRARHYIAARGVPAANLFAVKFDTSSNRVDPGHFAVQHAALNAKLHDGIQALLLTWNQPYKVGCMSMTSAFAFGYNVAFCAKGCKPTRRSAYFHSASTKPWRDFALRPTMMLAASDNDSAAALVSRGIDADGSMPDAAVYLLETSDPRRSVRKHLYPDVEKAFAAQLDVQSLVADAIYQVDDILLYSTGLKFVDGLDTLSFVPGAMADHLTSAGGQLTDSRQMSAMAWLEAGATASFGTALEPCNILDKFPSPYIQLWHYLRGATVLEAYWKSVRMPGQGNFIGEPLAAPFKGYRLKKARWGWELSSPALYRGRYAIYGGGFGGERYLGVQHISARQPSLKLHAPVHGSYLIRRLR